MANEVRRQNQKKDRPGLRRTSIRETQKTALGTENKPYTSAADKYNTNYFPPPLLVFTGAKQYNRDCKSRPKPLCMEVLSP